MKDDKKIIEECGGRYDEIIFEEDYIPKNIYIHQINLRNEIIHRCMENNRYKYVLDLGCGTGFHLSELNKFADNLIGVDMSFGALKQCNQKIKGDYVVCDANSLPFKKESIDFIWIAGVLHHLPDDLDNVISNIAYILKRDGIILIDEPNKYNIFNLINMKLSKADPTGDERPLSSGTVGDMLKKNDFIILETYLYELFSPMGVLLSNQFILDMCNVLDSFISKTFFKTISLRWYILARKE